ncbi:hypothetical protein Q7P37_001975 [Cladosporium fusiforme]
MDRSHIRRSQGLVHIFGYNPSTWTRDEMMLDAEFHELKQRIKAKGGVGREEASAAIAELVKKHRNAIPDKVPDVVDPDEGDPVPSVEDLEATVAAANRFTLDRQQATRTSASNSSTSNPPNGGCSLTEAERNQQRDARRTVCERLRNNNKYLVQGTRAHQYKGAVARQGMSGPFGPDFDLILANISRQVRLSDKLAELDDATKTDVMASFERQQSKFTLVPFLQYHQERYSELLEHHSQMISDALAGKSMRTTQQPRRENSSTQAHENSRADHVDRASADKERNSKKVAPRFEDLLRASQDPQSRRSGPPLYTSTGNSIQPDSSKRQAESPLDKAAEPKARKTRHPRSSSLEGLDESDPPSAGDMSTLSFDMNTSSKVFHLSLPGSMGLRRVRWNPDTTRDDFFTKVSSRFAGKSVESVMVQHKGDILVQSDDEWEKVKDVLIRSGEEDFSAVVYLG